MGVLLFLLSLAAGFIGVVVFAAAKGSVHETMGTVFWLIAAVFLTGAMIVSAIHAAAKRIVAKLDERPLPAPTARTPGAEGPYSSDLTA